MFVLGMAADMVVLQDLAIFSDETVSRQGILQYCSMDCMMC